MLATAVGGEETLVSLKDFLRDGLRRTARLWRKRKSMDRGNFNGRRGSRPMPARLGVLLQQAGGKGGGKVSHQRIVKVRAGGEGSAEGIENAEPCLGALDHRLG